MSRISQSLAKVRVGLEAQVSQHKQIIIYLIAGGYNTVFGFLFFAGLYFLLQDKLHYLPIAVISTFVSITNSFLVYRYLVFKSTSSIVREYVRIYAVYGASFILSLMLLALLVELLHMHPIAGQLIVTIASAVFSYFGNSRFTFKESFDNDSAGAINQKNFPKL
jgi:putative flippase GtrA